MMQYVSAIDSMTCLGYARLTTRYEGECSMYMGCRLSFGVRV